MEFRIVGLLEVADGPRSIVPRGSSCAHCSQSVSCTPMRSCRPTPWWRRCGATSRQRSQHPPGPQPSFLLREPGRRW